VAATRLSSKLASPLEPKEYTTQGFCCSSVRTPQTHFPPSPSPPCSPRSGSSLSCQHADATSAAQLVARRCTGAGKRASGGGCASGSTASQVCAVPRTLNLLCLHIQAECSL